VEFFSFEFFDRAGAVSALLLIAAAVITDKLVWHTRLKSAEARADRWEKIALEALTTGAQAGVKAAETTAELVSALPPEKNGGEP
jgi:hypothetical protein